MFANRLNPPYILTFHFVGYIVIMDVFSAIIVDPNSLLVPPLRPNSLACPFTFYLLEGVAKVSRRPPPPFSVFEQLLALHCLNAPFLGLQFREII